MIPAIGYMIGFYIFTRMIEMLGRTGGESVHIVARIFGWITLLVTILCLYILFQNEISGSQSLPDFMK